MKIIKQTNAAKREQKGVHREDGETMRGFLNQLIEAQIQDKMPDLPYGIHVCGEGLAEEPELARKVQDWFDVGAYLHILHGKEHLKKRQDLWETIKAGNYKLIQNQWGVKLGIEPVLAT